MPGAIDSGPSYKLGMAVKPCPCIRLHLERDRSL